MGKGGVRDGILERINSVAVFLHQRPADLLVEALNGLLGLLGDMSEDGVDHLGLVEALLALDDIFWGNTTLGKINVTCTRF